MLQRSTICKMVTVSFALLLCILCAIPGYAQLSGTKTIGGTTPDYATVKAAIQALNAQGVAAPGVTFTIRTGTYTEDSLIIRTNSPSAAAPVVFKPAAGATVVINVTPPSTTDNYAIKIDSTKYITFDGSNSGGTSRDMTINALGTNGQKGLWFSGNCSYAVVKNLNVNAAKDIATPTSTARCIDFLYLSGTGNDADYILVENNLTRYAYTGIRIEGVATGDVMESPIVRNNIADSVANAGVYSHYHNNALIYGNNLNVMRGSAATMYGIYVGTASFKTRVYNNLVHDMNQLSTTTSVTYGIYLSGSSTLCQHMVFNNFVWGLNVPATGTGAIYGIYSGTVNTTIPDTIAFNSVNLSGTGGGIRNSYAFYKGSATGPAIAWNNIFHNTRSDSSAITAAIGKTTAATVLTSNNNNLYVPTTADTTKNVGAIGTVRYKTIANWRTANSSDVASFSENTPFVSATNLHLQTTVPTQHESGAIPVAGITTDIDGQTRHASTPDVGADEGTFMLLDLTGPAISHTALANTPSTGSRVAAATIADPSGVASGAGAPRLWHRINAAATFTAVTADSTVGNTRYFTIPGAAAGSIIRYYIAAQDLATPNNASTLPSGGSGINPPGSTAPATVFSYFVQNPIPAGTYTVGVGANYPTIDSVFRRLNIDGVAGAVTFSLNDTSYAAPGKPLQNLRPAQSQYATVNGQREELALPSAYEFDIDTIPALTLTGPIPGASAVNRITFRPAAGKAVKILGSGAWVLRLLDASYVTFDGINTGGASLRLQAIAGAGLQIEGNSDNIIVQNMRFATPSFTAALTQSGTNGIPDSLLLQGNTVDGYSFNGFFGLNLAVGTGLARGYRIMNNDFGTATDSIAQAGMILQNIDGVIASGNRIRNVFKSTLTGNNLGIGAQTKYFKLKVYNNVIRDVGRRAGTAASTTSGISVFGASGDTTAADIYNNMIYGLDNQSTSTSGLIRGIYLSTGLNDRVAYNSVSLSGTDAAAILTAAFSSTVTGQSWWNNIGINARTATGAGRAVVFYRSATGTPFASNYNDLYTPTQALSFVGAVGTTNYATLNDWKATGLDSQSVSVAATFRTPDLHIDSTVATALNNAGTQVAGITTDFDGQTRSATTPDIGADEFVGLPFNVHDIGVASLTRTAANDAPAIRNENIDYVEQTDAIDLSSGSNVTFVAMADTARFRAIVQNYGSFPETTYQVRFTVNGNTISTVNNTRILAVGGRDTVNLAWNAGTPGAHVGRAFTILGSDLIRTNDTASVNFTISGGGTQQGDTLYTFIVPNQIILGVARMGTSNKLAFTSGGQSSTLTTDNKWIITTLNGTILDTTRLQQNPTTGQGFGFRDLAWDGRWLLTADNAQLRRIDTTTFTEVATRITGPGTLQRGVAWEMTNRIWKSNFTTDPVVKFDTAGATVKTLGVPSVAPYGIAFDKWTSPDRGYLWYSQPSTTGGPVRLSKVDTASGAVLRTFDYTAFTGTGVSGGLEIFVGHPSYPGRVIAALVVQNSPTSRCIIIDLGPDSSVAAPTPGWTARTSGTSVLLQSVRQVNANVIWTGGNSATVRRSIDGGVTFTNANPTPGVITGDIYNIDALDANTAFVTTSPGATFIYKTTNGGTTWTQVFTAASPGFINAIKMYDANNGIAEGDPVGGKFMILRTTDGGNTWARIATEPTPSPATETGLNNSLATVGTNNIWFGSSTGPVWRSTDAGATWGRYATGFTGNNLDVHFNSPTLGVTGNNSGLAARTTDGGLTWVATTLPGTGNLNGISGAGYEFFANRGTTVARSTDRGATWAVSYTGSVGTLAHLDFFATGTTSSASFYGTAVSQTGGIATAFFNLVTGVDDKTIEVPATFALAQNYPNPFNPSTTIRYALPEQARVNLSIYNMLGQRVAELTNDVQNVGFYNVVWDGRNAAGAQVATGVYFYRIVATPVSGGAPFNDLKKMLLLK